MKPSRLSGNNRGILFGVVVLTILSFLISIFVYIYFSRGEAPTPVPMNTKNLTEIAYVRENVRNMWYDRTEIKYEDVGVKSFRFPDPRYNLDQQQCGANFKALMKSKWMPPPTENYPKGMVKKMDPILTDFEDVSHLVDRLLILVLGENVTVEWVMRARSLYNIRIEEVRPDFFFEDIRYLVGGDIEYDYVYICRPSTYTYVTNLLHLIDKFKKENRSEPVYMGFPYEAVNGSDRLIYNTFDAGVLLSSESVEIVLILQKYQKFSNEVHGKVWDQHISRLLMKIGEFPEYNVAFHPEPMFRMLHYLRKENKRPKHWAQDEDKSTAHFPPITFGGMKAKNMKYMETPQRIPKIIHQIWFGKPPPAIKILMDNCRRIAEENGWEYRLWDRNSMDVYVISKKFAKDIKELNRLANVVRIEILLQLGGVWVDSDSLCHPNMTHLSDLLDEVYDAKKEVFIMCSSERYRKGLLCNGYLGMAPFSYSYYLYSRILSFIKGGINAGQSWRVTGSGILNPLFRTIQGSIFSIPSSKGIVLHFYDIRRMKKKGFNDAVSAIIEKMIEFDAYWGHIGYTTFRGLKSLEPNGLECQLNNFYNRGKNITKQKC